MLYVGWSRRESKQTGRRATRCSYSSPLVTEMPFNLAFIQARSRLYTRNPMKRRKTIHSETVSRFFFLFFFVHFQMLSRHFDFVCPFISALKKAYGTVIIAYLCWLFSLFALNGLGWKRGENWRGNEKGCVCVNWGTCRWGKQVNVWRIRFRGLLRNGTQIIFRILFLTYPIKLFEEKTATTNEI